MFVHWVHGLRHSLSVVGYNMHLDPAAMHNIDISELRICLSAHLARVWNNLAPKSACLPISWCAVVHLLPVVCSTDKQQGRFTAVATAS